MNDACRREVVDLHRFFEDWFTGRLDPPEEHVARLERVLDKDFEIISPQGTRISRAQLLDQLRTAHGAHKDRSCKIWIDNYAGRSLGSNFHLVTYEEWQKIGGVDKGRLSTAVFGKSKDTPNGVRWIAVHEVALPHPIHRRETRKERDPA